MLRDLDLADQETQRDATLRSLDDLQQPIERGAVVRIRPEFITVPTLSLGLVGDRVLGEIND